MIQSAFNTNIPGAFIGGVPSMGLAGTPFVGGGDIDPITPGIQINPGALTATGPPIVVADTGIMPTGMLTTAFGGMRASGVGFRGGIDLDPITPGVQAQPGIVTPVGPPRIIGGPGFIAMQASAMRTSGVIANNSMANRMMMSNNGFMTNGGMSGTVINGSSNTMVTSGIGGITGNGIIGVPATSGTLIGGISNTIIDADPITPGVQLQPGTVTPIGPPVIIGGQGAIGRSLSGALSGTLLPSKMTGSLILDADPLTPGLQSAIITPIPPQQLVGYGGGLITNRTAGVFCCPWWAWALIALLTLGAILGGLYISNLHSKLDNFKGIRIVEQNQKRKTQQDDESTDSKSQQNTIDQTKTIENTSTINPAFKNQTFMTNQYFNRVRTGNLSQTKNSIESHPIPVQNKTTITSDVSSTIPSTNQVNQIQNNTNSNQNDLNNQNNLNNGNNNQNNNQNNIRSSSIQNNINRRNKTRFLKRIVTKTTLTNQVVDAFQSEPKYKHLKRSKL